MNELALTGGHIITPIERRFASLSISGGVITSIGADESKEPAAKTLDVSGCYVTPGLVDLQVNGDSSCDFWAEPSEDDLQKLCQDFLRKGITCFLPTLITADVKRINQTKAMLERLGMGAASLANDGKSKFPIRMPGCHLEGPCLSPERPGVHPKNWLKPLNKDIVNELLSPSVKLITLAPELDPSGEAVKLLLKNGVTVSLGHSNATWEEANDAFAGGIKVMTHTYNALPPLHHRQPGAVIAAMLDDSVYCCVICDGLHVNPAAVRLLLKAKGVDKVVLVTDIAHVGTTGGGLVGSSITLDDAVKHVVEWKVADFGDAVRMASYNAARAIAMDNAVGHLAPGKNADIVVWEQSDLSVRHVIVGGRVAYSR